MNNFAKATIILTGAACTALLVIHRRVIVAALTGEEMPEPPEWHKKCFPCCWDNAEDVEVDVNDDYEEF